MHHVELGVDYVHSAVPLSPSTSQSTLCCFHYPVNDTVHFLPCNSNSQWRRQAWGTGARALPCSLRMHANFADLTPNGFHFWMTLSQRTSESVRNAPVPPLEQNSGDGSGNILEDTWRHVHQQTFDEWTCTIHHQRIRITTESAPSTWNAWDCTSGGLPGNCHG